MAHIILAEVNHLGSSDADDFSWTEIFVCKLRKLKEVDSFTIAGVHSLRDGHIIGIIIAAEYVVVGNLQITLFTGSGSWDVGTVGVSYMTDDLDLWSKRESTGQVSTVSEEASYDPRTIVAIYIAALIRTSTMHMPVGADVLGASVVGIGKELSCKTRDQNCSSSLERRSFTNLFASIPSLASLLPTKAKRVKPTAKLVLNFMILSLL
jgi:hypothetical protein